jgi:putative hydrolase
MSGNQPSNNSPSDDDLPPDPFADGDPFDPKTVTPSSQGNATGPTSGSPADPLGAFGGLGSLFGPMLGDLSKLFAQQQQSAWEQARQFAVMRASGDGQSGPSPDVPVAPLDRIRLEELVAIVERHVITATGLELAGPKGLKVNAVNRAQWASDFLEQHRSVLEPAIRVSGKPQTDGTQTGNDQTGNDIATESPGPGSPDALITNMMGLIGPALVSMQIGAMAGQLSHRYLASGDLPLPRSHPDRVTFVPGNINRFARDWSLPMDSLYVRVAIDELALHGVTRIAHIRELLNQLMATHVGGFRIDNEALMERFADMGTMDPESMQAQLGSLAGLSGTTSPQQQRTASELRRLHGLIRGFVDHVGNVVGTQLLGGDQRIVEALRRRRFEADDATALLSSLVGLQLTEDQQQHSNTFFAGIVERLGDEATPVLSSMWENTARFPTDAELAAPGLWLARLEFS